MTSSWRFIDVTNAKRYEKKGENLHFVLDDILCKKIDKVAEHLNRQKPVLITSKGGPSSNSEKSEKTTSRMRNRTVSK